MIRHDMTLDQGATFATSFTWLDAEGAGIDGTGKRESSVLLCRIARVGGDPGDTFTGAAFGISFDIHFQIESPGSVTEYPTP